MSQARGFPEGPAAGKGCLCSVCVPFFVVRVTASVSGAQAIWYVKKRERGDRKMEGESEEAEQKEERLRETSNLLGNSEELSAFRYFKKMSVNGA